MPVTTSVGGRTSVQHRSESDVRGTEIDFLRLPCSGPIARTIIRRAQPRPTLDDAARAARGHHHLVGAGRVCLPVCEAMDADEASSHEALKLGKTMLESYPSRSYYVKTD